MVKIFYLFSKGRFYFYEDLEAAKKKRKEIIKKGGKKTPVRQKQVRDYSGSIYLYRKDGFHIVFGSYWKAKERAYKGGTVKRYVLTPYKEYIRRESLKPMKK